MYLYVISYNSINIYLCRYNVILCVCKAGVARVVIMAKRNLFEALMDGIEEIKSNRPDKTRLNHLCEATEHRDSLVEKRHGLDS